VRLNHKMAYKNCSVSSATSVEMLSVSSYTDITFLCTHITCCSYIMITVRAIEENIVGFVLICTLFVWVPVSLGIHFLVSFIISLYNVMFIY